MCSDPGWGLEQRKCIALLWALQYTVERSKGFQLHSCCEAAFMLLAPVRDYFQFQIDQSLFIGRPCRPLKQETQVNLSQCQYFFGGIETTDEYKQRKSHEEAKRRAKQVKSTNPAWDSRTETPPVCTTTMPTLIWGRGILNLYGLDRSPSFLGVKEDGCLN